MGHSFNPQLTRRTARAIQGSDSSALMPSPRQHDLPSPPKHPGTAVPEPAVSEASTQSNPEPSRASKTAAHPAPAKPQPLLFLFTAAYGALHVCVFLQMFGLSVASFSAAKPNPWTTGYLTLTAYEMLTLGLTANTLHGIFTSRFTHGQLTDRFLVILAGIFPVFNILLTLLHPPFLTTMKNWAAGLAFVMAFGVSACKFPLAHSLVQWVVTTILFTFLDCYAHAHQQQECPTSIWGLPACLLTQGLVIGGTGLAAWLTAHILITKSSARLRSQAESITQHDQASDPGTASGSLHGEKQQADAATSSLQGEARSRSPLPFESWGLRMPPAVFNMVNRADQALVRLAEHVNEDMLVQVVCFPIVLYSFLFCLLARLKFQGLSYCDMSSETFLVYMMAWFMAGRNSSNFDVMPLMLQIQTGISASFARAAHRPSLTELVDRVRQHVTGGASEAEGASGRMHQITVTELLGEGTFGKVYKGMWRGTAVAVKRMVLPGDVMKSDRRERMAIMEAAISGALVHPNIVQTYTYTVKSVQGDITAPSEVQVGHTLHQSLLPEVPGRRSVPKAEGSEVSRSTAVDALEVQLVLEYMDCGTLRDVLDDGCFLMPSPSKSAPSIRIVNYHAVLETAADVAKGMMHLHSLNVVHCDLKARNVLLRSCASDPRSFTAKVGDFGLSLKLDSGDGHVGSMFQGTATHMAPEVHTEGRQSKAADVFSFGITMWEMYTGGRPFQDVRRDLMGYNIAQQHGRPSFPDETPNAYSALAARCWDQDPENRPGFEEVVDCLTELLPAASAERTPVLVNLLGTQTTSIRPLPGDPLRLRPGAAGPPAAAVGGAVGSPGLVSRPEAGVLRGSKPPEQAQGLLQRATSGQPALTRFGRGGRGQDASSSVDKGLLAFLVRTAADESEQRPSLVANVPALSLSSCPGPGLRSEDTGDQAGLSTRHGGLAIVSEHCLSSESKPQPSSHAPETADAPSGMELLSGVVLLGDGSTIYS